MFARLRKTKDQTMLEPLVLVTSDGVSRRIFDGPSINTYRRMLTGLLYRSSLPKRVTLVGALREEGVTFSALALGLTLAHDTNRRIAVVELNWWYPGLQQLIEPVAPKAKKPVVELPPPLSPSPGMSGVMRGEATFQEAMIATAMPNLWLLPAGDVPLDQRATMARSEQIRTTVDELSEQFDHVIIDVPALMATSDGVALASLGDASILVIRQGATQVTQVKQALDEVAHLQMMGVILNQTKIATPRWLLRLVEQE